MINWIKQLFCKHDWMYLADEVSRQIEKRVCRKCDKEESIIKKWE